MTPAKIDVVGALKVAVSPDEATTVVLDHNGNIIIHNNGNGNQKTIVASSFKGSIYYDTAVGRWGSEISFVDNNTLSLATTVVSGPGVAGCNLYSIDIPTAIVSEIVGCSNEVSYSGSPWTVITTGNRFVRSQKMGTFAHLHIKSKSGLNAYEVFKIMKDPAGKTVVSPVPTRLGLTSQPNNALSLVDEELFFLSYNQREGGVLNAYSFEKGRREIQVPKDCLYLKGATLSCGKPGARSFTRIGEPNTITVSSIFTPPMLAASEVTPSGDGRLNVFTFNSLPQPYNAYVGENAGIGIIDLLNKRSVSLSLPSVNVVGVFRNKLLVGTPTGSFFLFPTLINDISQSGGVVQGAGINFSVPGFKSEVLVNGSAVPATITETTFRATLAVPPSGVAEISLRLTSLLNGAIAKSLNVAKVEFPTTILQPKIDRITTMDRITNKQVVISELSPNMAVSFHGSNIGGGLPAPFDSAHSLPLPTRLNSLEVVLDRTRLLRMYLANSRQVDLVIPDDVIPGKHTLEFIRYNGAEIPTVEARSETLINVVKANPVLRTVVMPAGWETIEAYRPLREGEVVPQIVTPENPLIAGETITAQGTGFGKTLDPIPYGDMVVLDSPAIEEVRVFVNGQPAAIRYIGSSTWPGVFQVSFEIPPLISPDERGLYSIAFQYVRKEENGSPSFREEIHFLNGNPQE